MTAHQIRSLQPALAARPEQFRLFFKREGTFRHWERYLLGLMADLKRKCIEPIALAGGVEPFWFEPDRLGQRGVGEARPNFLCWSRLPLNAERPRPQAG